MKEHQTFVITGVTAGLGKALAAELLRQGHRVHGCGRRKDPFEDEVPGGDSSRYSFRKMDVLDFEALQNWASEIVTDGQPVDYLIHNAAVIHTNAPLWKIDRDQLASVINVNISGSFNVLQAFLPAMLEERHGILITLSSGAGRSGFPEISAYCASKWAVEGMMKSLAAELPEGMAAFPMSPGVVDTDMLQSTFGESASNHQKPDEWAVVAVDYIQNIRLAQSGESLTVPASR